MKGTILGWLVLVASAWFVAPGCAQTTEDKGTDGATHFLAACGEANPCDDGWQCLCGMCTSPCRDDGACDATFGESVCVDAPLGCGTDAPRQCSLTCMDDADCAQDDLACSPDGLCLLRALATQPTPGPDAAAPNGLFENVECTAVLDPISAEAGSLVVFPLQVAEALSARGVTLVQPESEEIIARGADNWQLLYLFAAALEGFITGDQGDVTHALDDVDCDTVVVPNSVLSQLGDLPRSPGGYDEVSARRACAAFKDGVANGYRYQAFWRSCAGCTGRRWVPGEFDWYRSGDGRVEVRTETCLAFGCPAVCNLLAEVHEFRSDWPPAPVTETLCIPLDERCQ